MEYTAIFQGGGVKGIAYVGAILALDELGYKCIRASGTSIGSIFASLLIAGYSGIELYDIIQYLRLNYYIKKENKLLKSIINDKGIYSLYYIENLIANLLMNKNIYGFENNNLKVVAYNVSNKEKIIFPDILYKYNIKPASFSIAKAVTMSSSYPAFFKPIKFNNMYIIDGGVVDNFPYDVFEYNDNELVFGFLLNEKKIKNIPNNINIISLNTRNIKTLDFNISKSKQLEVIKQAYLDTKKQLFEFKTNHI